MAVSTAQDFTVKYTYFEIAVIMCLITVALARPTALRVMPRAPPPAAGLYARAP